MDKIKNKRISEKYRKYIIKILCNDKHYYSVWGTDLFDNDKLLLNKDDKIIFYKELSNLNSFLNSDNAILFDHDNFISWIMELNFSEESVYCIYDLDSLIVFENKDQEFINKKNADTLINVINLIGDYVSQTKNKKILKLIDDKDLRAYKDLLYDNYLWLKPNNVKAIEPNIFPKVQIRNIINTLRSYFIEQIDFK